VTEYVYLIGSEASSLVKIGRSTDVPGRLGALQSGSPVKLSVIWQTEGGAELEAALHRHFSASRSHGEWFAFPDGDAIERVQRGISEIRAEAERRAEALRAARKARKIKQVWKEARQYRRRQAQRRRERSLAQRYQRLTGPCSTSTAGGTRTPRCPDTRDGFTVGDVVKICRKGWEYTPTGTIRAIAVNGEHPFVVEENDGRRHWYLPLFREDEIVAQTAVTEIPVGGMCDRTGCVCADMT
jgi:hypothetical protein